MEGIELNMSKFGEFKSSPSVEGNDSFTNQKFPLGRELGNNNQ